MLLGLASSVHVGITRALNLGVFCWHLQRCHSFAAAETVVYLDSCSLTYYPLVDMVQRPYW